MLGGLQRSEARSAAPPPVPVVTFGIHDELFAPPSGTKRTAPPPTVK
jgi:hypothetical protein